MDKINEIRDAISSLEITLIRHGDEGLLKDVFSVKTIKTAIKALEKQTVKTPVQSFYNEGDHNWECVSCEELVVGGQDYCHHCGQKLV